MIFHANLYLVRPNETMKLKMTVKNKFSISIYISGSTQRQNFNSDQKAICVHYMIMLIDNWL